MAKTQHVWELLPEFSFWVRAICVAKTTQFSWWPPAIPLAFSRFPFLFLPLLFFGGSENGPSFGRASCGPVHIFRASPRRHVTRRPWRPSGWAAFGSLAAPGARARGWDDCGTGWKPTSPKCGAWAWVCLGFLAEPPPKKNCVFVFLLMASL